MRNFFASSPSVKPSFVFDGEISASPASLVNGISALATLELNGPTIAITELSAMNVLTFCAPAAGSWMPWTASSSRLGSSL